MVNDLSKSAAIVRSLSGTFRQAASSTQLWKKGTMWVWPIGAMVLLSVIALFVRSIVENSTKRVMAENLKTILNADVAALQIWLDTQRKSAAAIAADKETSRLVGQLVQLANAEGSTTGTLLQSPELAELRAELTPWLEAHEYAGFAVLLKKDAQIIASMRDELIGRKNLRSKEGILDDVFAKKIDDPNQGKVTRPFKSFTMLEDEAGQARAERPTMFAAAPVRDADGRAIAVIGLRITPEKEFTEILSIARAGKTGETYAFDPQGTLISLSRFDEDLKQIGLLTDNADAKSILNIQIRDPQVDMSLGKRPKLRRSEQPLTRMAADAVQGNSGVDVDGYRDYRGTPVIGAWTWLEEYDFGVATEVDVAEAYAALYILRYSFWSLFALVAAGSGVIFVFTIVVARKSREARHAVIKAKKLGQYTLDEKIGEGGMGVVYRGHHAMLRRPTAIKLLNADQTSDDAIARFEREVKLTSQLTHPNTIVVYDYGRTPEGIFYYAMEYLQGIDLQELVLEHGPQCDGRVIGILRQILGSLAEAHEAGLIHRDIKPANIMLTERGGIADFVKVLDFGLAKAVDGRKQATLTMAQGLTGTPLYLSPEGVDRPDSVDAKSDIYAVGAVAYYLLTGTPVFEGQTVMEICMKQVKAQPEPLSKRTKGPISADLEALVMLCLEKDPAARPGSARELQLALGQCVASEAWTSEQAQQWWSQLRTGSVPKPQIDHGNVTTAPVDADETFVFDLDEPNGS